MGASAEVNADSGVVHRHNLTRPSDTRFSLRPRYQFALARPAICSRPRMVFALSLSKRPRVSVARGDVSRTPERGVSQGTMHPRTRDARSIALASLTTITLLIATSCGSGTTTGQVDGGEGGVAHDGGDAALRSDGDSGETPLADAPFPCGKTTCRVDQYCLQPCCGGPAPRCEPANDAGGCPPGFLPGLCFPLGGTGNIQGCKEAPCTPDPPSCIDDPEQRGPTCERQGASRYLSCVCA
jgi:hypothetical protein